MIKRLDKTLLRNMAIATGLVLLTFILVWRTLGVRYMVNDDAIISNIASGAYGGQRWRLVYVNILVGFVLQGLYLLTASVNWFFALLLAGGIFCFAALCTLLLNRLPLWQGLLASAVLLLLGGTEFFHKFHYVSYGSLFLVTGFVLLALHLGKWRPSTVLGLLLVFAGSLLRFDMLLAVGGIALPVLLCSFLRLDKAARLRTVAMAVGLLVLVVGAKVADTVSYKSDPGWATYTRFNAARTEISDYKLQFLATDDETLAAYGLSGMDYFTLEAWAFYDPEVFPLERVEALAAALPGNSLGSAAASTGYFLGRLFHTKLEHLLLSGVVLLWLLFSRKRNWPVFMATFGIFLAELCYLNWMGRYPQRIDSALVLALAVFLTLCLRGLPKPGLRWPVLASAVLVLGLVPTFTLMKAESDDYFASRLPAAARFDAVAADKQNLYLVDTVFVDAANGYRVWQARPEGYFSNVTFVGSWLMYAPPQQQAMQAFGVENPYADSLGRDDVLFVDYYNRALKEEYIREHYDPTVQLVVVEEYGDMNAYRAVTE